MLTTSIGMERLHMVATALASNASWRGCAVDTRCGSVVFTLGSPAAARLELGQGMMSTSPLHAVSTS